MRLHRNHLKRLDLLEQLSRFPLNNRKALELEHLRIQIRYAQSTIKILETLLENERENVLRLEQLREEYTARPLPADKDSVLSHWIAGK